MSPCSLNNLAELLQDTNRLAEAEPLMRRALAIDEKSFGPEHPNVASGSQQPGRAAAGHQPAGGGRAALSPRAGHRREELRPRASQRRHGPQQPGLLLQATNRLAEAEPLYRRALAIDEKSFGPEHPNVATASTTWPLLQATNRLAEAEPLYRRALAIDEKSFGPDHPNVAIDLNNLACCCRPPTGWPRPSR